MCQLTMVNNLKQVETKINSYNREQELELKKKLLGFDDDYAQWEFIMNTLYTSSKESIRTVQNSELLIYFLLLFKDTIYEKEMLSLFVELDDSVDQVIKKMDKLYFEACHYIESLLYLKSRDKTKLNDKLES